MEQNVTPAEQAPEISRVDPRLLEILVCPLTKTTLEYDAANQELISRPARLASPPRDRTPTLPPQEGPDFARRAARLSHPRRHPDHAPRRSAEDRRRAASDDAAPDTDRS